MLVLDVLGWLVAWLVVEVADRSVCEVVLVTLFLTDLSDGGVPASVVSGNVSSSPSAATSPAAAASKRGPCLQLASTSAPSRLSGRSGRMNHARPPCRSLPTG